MTRIPPFRNCNRCAQYREACPNHAVIWKGGLRLGNPLRLKALSDAAIPTQGRECVK